MEEIYRNGAGRVYVGDDSDYLRLVDREDFSFLRCCKYGPGGHQQLLGYHSLAAPEGAEHFVAKRKHHMALNLLDLYDPHYINAEMVQEGLAFVYDEMSKGKKVLIACNHGHSRGPTIGLMFLGALGEMPHAFLHSERIYHTIYPQYNPKDGVRQFARSHWPSLKETGKVQ